MTLSNNTNPTNIYPWQAVVWDQMTAAVHKQRLAPAILLTAAPGLGEIELAHFYARLILCEHAETSNVPCNRCRSCQLTHSGTHPDFYVIKPEAKHKTIKIDAVRQTLPQLQQTRHHSPIKAALIENADQLNIAASNALLKTLEEAEFYKCHFILTTTHSHALLPTILSRCAHYKLTADEHAIQNWLKEKLPDVFTEKAKPVLEYLVSAPLTLLQWYDQGYLEVIIKLWESFSKLKEKQMSHTIKIWEKYDIALLLEFAYLKIYATIKTAALSQIKNFEQQMKYQEILSYILNCQKQLQRNIAINQTLCLEQLHLKWGKLL